VALLRNNKRPERNGLYLGLGKTGKALLITQVFSNLTFNFKLCYKGVKITKLLSFSN